MRTVVLLLVACIALASAAEFAQQFEDFKTKAAELQALNPLADVSAEEFQSYLNEEAFFERAMKESKNEKLEFSEAEVRALMDDEFQ